MRQVAARRHHNKKRAEGFIPNQHGQDNTNNDNTGDTPAGNNGSSSAAITTTTTAQSSSSIVRTTTTTTTTPPAPVTTTTTTTQPTTTSTTTTSSSSSVVVVSTTTTPAVIQATTPINQIPTTASVPITRSVATPTIGTASFSSASPSASAAAADSGPQIGPLIGAIGGGLVGVIALAAIAGYFFRRTFRKKDEFDRSDFVRNSVAIRDDWSEKPAAGTQSAMALARGGAEEPSATPRPPSMLERRGQAQPAYGVGETMNAGYYGQQDQYYNYGNNGYYGQDQYAAGYDQHQHAAGYDQHQQYPAGDHPYVAGSAYGYTPPNEYQQSQLTRKPSAPLGAARGPESEYQQQQQGQDHVASPAQGYSTAAQFDARHQSVTPFQQQQYNDINKALNGGVTPVAESPAGGRELSTAYSTLNQPQQPAQGQQPHGNSAAPNVHQPAANNRKSLYDDEDAYGGI
ncbi:hypothetical protein M407DRAFT_98770 [Tulasnella calospora MUT 4182]|uniref:Uncharacterized protein n=1 Tax=Tulasnella calospora MUT 4182 TaxID=1051891 RepID=A0A0C3KT71_9AGAM|nr:hypothetical protein M407DRAFT_98770 [Tulasnella calospora MUT 4182]